MKKIWVYLRPFLSWKFLISYLIPFAFVNGWAWVGSFLFTLGWVNWFTIAAVTWLGILWLPWTPEKLITIPAAMWIHTRLFRNDAATRKQLDVMYAEALKDWNRIKGWFKRKGKKKRGRGEKDGKEGREKDGKGLSGAKSTQRKKNIDSNKENKPQGKA